MSNITQYDGLQTYQRLVNTTQPRLPSEYECVKEEILTFGNVMPVIYITLGSVMREAF